jgi:hypothetical protein
MVWGARWHKSMEDEQNRIIPSIKAGFWIYNWNNEKDNVKVKKKVKP